MYGIIMVVVIAVAEFSRGSAHFDKDATRDGQQNKDDSEEPAKRAATVKKVLANAIDGLIQKFEMRLAKENWGHMGMKLTSLMLHGCKKKDY